MCRRKVTVSVHQRNDTGYAVRLVVKEGEEEQVAKYPTSTQEEAEALAESIKGYVKAGCDLSPLLADTGEGE